LFAQKNNVINTTNTLNYYKPWVGIILTGINIS
jgi:hypothetical protein